MKADALSRNIQQLLTQDAARLAAALALDASTARIEAQSLLQHVLNVSRAYLLAHPERCLDDHEQASYDELLHRRLLGEPLAYILGEREFFGLMFKVTPATLIPRPETELLVELALQHIPSPPAPDGTTSKTTSHPTKPASGQVAGYLPLHPQGVHSGCTARVGKSVTSQRLDRICTKGLKPQQHTQAGEGGRQAGRGGEFRLLDLGTGSGAIALSFAHAHPDAEVLACDVSPAALEVAQENAQRLGVSNATFLHGNWYSMLDSQRFDLIVSNPPYVAVGDQHLQQGDLRFEPPAALSSGPDGLEDIRHIVAEAPTHLHPGGWLLLEHGYDQAAQVRELLREAGLVEVFSARDLSGIERVSGGCMLDLIGYTQ